MNGNEIRNRFLDFFKKNGHVIKPSASLLPDDPTVLFSIAGMVQFKKMFMGEVPLEFTRAATSQKCVRTNDIDNVGRTARHHTFFEMLGNFSFGDYFKKEAIAWSWEFLTRDLLLSPEKLYITIYKNDDESFDIWHKELKIPQNKIFRMGDESNFWTMGDTGPCGPCSEIIYDLGPEFGCNKPECNVGCDCDRYLEIWNLVFTQYDRLGDGKLVPLPKKNIDTGMGLERLARIIQKKNNNFETDIIFPLIRNLETLTGIEYGKSNENDRCLKIIADHIRAITFLIGDGVIPSNEERGYVLRKLIRRSIVHSMLLGYKELYLYKLSNQVIEMMKQGYPDLIEKKEYINKTIFAEEENFLRTLERAQATFNEIVARSKKSGNNLISGEDAFILSDTYGLPISITETMAQNYNLKVDIAAYEKFLESQQNRSREDWHKKASSEQDMIISSKLPDTKFVGYNTLTTSSKIIYLAIDNSPCNEILQENANVTIVLNETPFYAESGGQVGDTGIICIGKNNKIIIENTVKYGSYYVHIGHLVQGKFKNGDEVQAAVDEERRKSIARNHTSTHLLQAMLRRVFGAHINQAGSLVTPDYLRFDFTHTSGLERNEISRIEELANDNILSNFNVGTQEKFIAEAKKEGATALFGEKYGDTVRVVTIGDISKELCGGTHVKNTGEIGSFKILKEESVGSGVRRIEAITGTKVLSYFRDQEVILSELCDAINSTPDMIKNKIVKLQDTIKNLEKEYEKLKLKLAGNILKDIIDKAEDINGKKIIQGILPDMNQGTLRNTIDDLKNKFPSGVFILGSGNNINDKPMITIGITKNLTPNLHAGNIIKEAAGIIGGKGGGRPDMAQSGGTEPWKLEEAIQFAVELAKKKL
ncbi:alanine--tRNA ligase [Candidatus Poribacteria bacterium]|nr:alanine--tRNA ligase [Candidatus Poribacteria bacterium]